MQTAVSETGTKRAQPTHPFKISVNHAAPVKVIKTPCEMNRLLEGHGHALGRRGLFTRMIPFVCEVGLM